jgi:hypothetical protein
MLATGSVVTASTAIRAATSAVGLAAQRTPALVRLGLRGSAGLGDTAKARAEFRDELVALARESAELSWREMRRGVDDLDRVTRPADEHAPPRRAHRPYRVKP